MFGITLLHQACDAEPQTFKASEAGVCMCILYACRLPRLHSMPNMLDSCSHVSRYDMLNLYTR